MFPRRPHYGGYTTVCLASISNWAIRLIETGAESHFFWLGAKRQTVSDAIRHLWPSKPNGS